TPSVSSARRTAPPLSAGGRPCRRQGDGEPRGTGRHRRHRRIRRDRGHRRPRRVTTPAPLKITSTAILPAGSTSWFTGGILLLVLAGCGADADSDPASGPPDESPSTADPPASVAVGGADTVAEAAVEDGGWTTPPAPAEREVAGVVTVTGFRIARHESFDRFVITFADEAHPTHRVEFASGAAMQCGSGESVDIRGEAVLTVRLEPARAHDDAGNVTVSPRDSVVGLPALIEARVV